MTAPSLRLDFRSDSVAVLAIDQPDSKVNILTAQLWSELEAVIDSLANRADLKGLVLASGKPGIFIAGADIKLLANAPGPNDPAVRAFMEQGLRVLEKLQVLPFPTVAAIDGAALGGGLEVALACDYRIAGANPKVQLGLPEVKLGLIPGWGGTQRLPRLIGVAKSAELLRSGASLTAAEAENFGLVALDAGSDLVAAAVAFIFELQSSAEFLAQDGIGADWLEQRDEDAQPVPDFLWGDVPPVPADAPPAVREGYEVLVRGAALTLHEGIGLETAAFLRLAGSPESKRLIAEFFASRKR